MFNKHQTKAKKGSYTNNCVYFLMSYGV